ncbi:hypothetical protein CspeluHIS016_0112130 [Cutaneotrichosporon spelunceum]|uniref:Uncharacterized protein n=1 Tax=Cutaneotrichosporon spelunceum TaxID=1672016 RepID=A0AAD3TQG1_9TREE|nr:hypothetical protein CspeluHIS016_0112130 [Cutaneotrichosporon spelunceum]
MARGLLRYLLAPGDPLQAVGQGQRTVNVRAELACRLAVLKATGHAHPSWVMTVTHSFCEPAAEGKGALPALTAS